MANYVLEILDGDRAGDVLPVTERALRIGRKAGNDIVLADEKTSGVHAEVVLEGDRYVLRDLGSTNGTFLDGKRITEMVLTPGDVVSIGRIRIAFRDSAASSAAADAGELAVRRLDASRLQRRGGSVWLLAALLVLGLGAAGWLWWRGQATPEHSASGPRQRPVLAVAGNRLDADVGGCETETGWNLRAAGAGFQSTGSAHTGSGAFEALRDAEAGPEFALATLHEPVAVFGGRALTIAAHVRTSGGALVGVRAVCFAQQEQQPFRFRTGSALAAHGDWTRVEAQIAVPPGSDRLLVELVAVLPAPGAAVVVDDVAVVEGGAATPTEHKLAESSQTLLGTGAAFAVRSVDPENPATLFEVLPHGVPAPFAALQRAGLCVLSDLGATLAAVPSDRSFQIAVEGTGDLQLVFPADSAGGCMVAGEDGRFTPAAAEAEYTVRQMLLGGRSTRALLSFEAPVVCVGEVGGGRYRLRVASNRLELVLGFRSERQQASELLRQARARLAQNEPGRALELVRELAQTVPMDVEELAQAQGLRAQIVADQAAALQQLQREYDEAEFFDTRGGFERVVRGLDDLLARHGESNLEDAAAALALRERATVRLAALNAAEAEAERQRLVELAQAFAENDQAGLARVVETYVQQHLEPK